METGYLAQIVKLRIAREERKTGILVTSTYLIVIEEKRNIF